MSKQLAYGLVIFFLLGGGLNAMDLPIGGEVRGGSIAAEPLDDKASLDVIVVGAGAAGLAAASELQKNGCKVVVLEGNDRIGGRVFTDRSLPGGPPINRGAAWIHKSEGNPLAGFARSLGLGSYLKPYETHQFVYLPNGSLLEGEVQTRFYQLWDELRAYAFGLRETLSGDQSVQSAVDSFILSKQLKEQDILLINKLVALYVEPDYAADASMLSLMDLVSGSGRFEGPDILFPEYDCIINSLAEGLTIQLNQKVSTISYNHEGVIVQTDGGKRLYAKYAVCTVPLGVLKRNVITFVPELPAEKKQVIARLQMGLLNKVILQFPDRFWHENGVVAYITESNAKAYNFVDFLAHVGKPILVGHIAGTAAKYFESKKDDEIIEEIMSYLKGTYGDAIPYPTHYIITRWSQDPFSYGSYSYVPVGVSSNERKVLAEPVAGRLFFAGEATDEQDPATVHGAYLSGIREAERIIKEYMRK